MPRTGWLAGGSVLGALLASSCCILPLALFSLGIGGAWMSHLTALEAYQPIFVALTLLPLAGGFYSAYRRPRRSCRANASGNDDQCGTGGYCGTRLADRISKIALWSATLLVTLALTWPYLAPRLLG